ncbi:hypothetical protein FRB96_004377 [Tulasnella sp. 330]|nr:hypothetical protein FRB96_004377 [Tulasnella sp. 330]
MQLLPMACDSLKILELRIKRDCSAASVATTLRGLDARNVRLEELKIEAWFDASAIELPLVSYLCDQRELRVVGLPEYYGTKDIVTVLGTLPLLGEVHTTNHLEETELGMEWELGNGTFKALSSFSFNTPLTTAEHVLSRHSLSQLSAISIAPPSAGGMNDGIRPFFVALSLFCSELRSLRLDICQYPPDFPAVVPLDLDPLLRLGQLQVLEIDARKPVVGMGAHFVQKIAASWQNLRRLHITPEPTHDMHDNVGNPLSLLRTLAASFEPCRIPIESIGLYFRVDSAELLDKQLQTYALPTLRELNIGTSRILKDQMLSTASFLGGICGSELVIRTGRGGRHILVDTEINTQVEEVMADRWRQTAATLNLFHSFQSPVRYKIDVLQSKAMRARGEKVSWRQIPKNYTLDNTAF